MVIHKHKKTSLWGEFNIPKNLVEPIKGCDPIHQPTKDGKKIGWNTDECKRKEVKHLDFLSIF